MQNHWKKKLTISTIIISCLIIALSIYAFRRFVQPVLINSRTKTEFIELSSNSEIIIQKNSDQSSIFNLEITLSGNTTDNIELTILNSKKEPVELIKIKKGKIDFMYRCDWYDDSAILKFENKNNGNLTLEYRFIGLN